VIYTRVSTEDQADYGTGLETQQIECARYAERMGAAVVGLESDPGISGTVYPRPGLDRAIALLENGQADTLLAHRVDRIGRKAYIPMVVYERIKATRASLCTVEDGGVTDENIIMFSLRCGLAQTDYNRIVQNLKAGKRRLAEKGLAPTRSLSPYGYRIVQKVEQGVVKEEAGTYVVIEGEAAVVREIFTRYAAGDSLSAICRYLQQRGVAIPKPTKASSDHSCWQATMVSRILKQTAYKGYVLWGKTQTSYQDKSKLSFEARLNCRKPEGRKRVTTDTPEQLQVRITVPAIVDAALWEACQTQREKNLEAGGVRNDRKHLFASIVRCPNCKRRMNSGHVHYRTRSTTDRPIIYRCRDHAPSQNAADYVCHRTMYHESEIRASVRRLFLAIIETPQFVRAALDVHLRQQAAGYSQEDHMALIDRLRELDAREQATAQGYTRAIQLGTRPEVFEKLLTDIAVERRQLQQQKAAMEAALTERQAEDPQAFIDVVTAYARDLIEMLDSADLDTMQQNAALRRVLREITPEPDGYRIVMEPIYQVDIQEAPVTGIVIPVK
jgi:DNA invertase Pin-like site-specific DNA recombinase